MGKNSSIEWTHHTFNPWWGCTKVSPACQNCYAESIARRYGHGVWGAKAPRRFFGEDHWKEPLRWNAKAQSEGRRKRVFCASMADVFEAREELEEPRRQLWELIGATASLDWLLLTKRPESVAAMVPWLGFWPDNVWIGTTVENQEWADRRLPFLARLPAARRFLSCEPLLGSLDLSNWLHPATAALYPINWVIVGGESGPQSRAMSPVWVTDLRNACIGAEVPFLFKQWGCWAPADAFSGGRERAVVDPVTKRTFPMRRLSKIAAGRELEGRTWDEVPGGLI